MRQLVRLIWIYIVYKGICVLSAEMTGLNSIGWLNARTTFYNIVCPLEYIEKYFNLISLSLHFKSVNHYFIYYKHFDILYVWYKLKQ